MADPYTAGQTLGSALFGSQRGTYDDQLGRSYKIEQALQQARQARSSAMLASQINDQRALVTPELVSGVLGGDAAALGTLGSISLLANDKFDAGQLSDVLGAAARGSARTAALGGDWDAANANLMGAANGPQELGAVQGQNLMQNRFLTGGGGITTTEQGLAGIRQSDASAGASRAQAQKTLGDLDIKRQTFALQRSGQWNPSGKGDGNTLGSKSAGVPSEGERKAATLLSRLESSLGQMNTAIGEDEGAARPGIIASVVGKVPFSGEVARNFVTSSGRQRVEAAQLDMLDAALTLGTGAAYTREQLEGYRKAYFPQLGDSEDTVSDKQARLQNIVESARIAAGRAAPTLGDTPPSAPANGQGLPPAPPGARRRYNPATGRVE